MEGRYKIWDGCSDEAKSYIKSYEDSKGVTPYTRGRKLRPWGQLKIGQCFLEPFDGADIAQLRNLAAQQKYFRKKEYVIIKHPSYKVYEVTRIA